MKDLNNLLNEIKNTIDYICNQLHNNIAGPHQDNTVRTLLSNINELSFEIRSKDEKIYKELIDIKNNLFFGANFVHPFMLGRLVEIMRIYDFDSQNNFWQYIHPKIVEISKKKFEDGYYTGSLQTALVEICDTVRSFRQKIGAKEIISDTDMMYNTFSNEKLLCLADCSNTSLKNIQERYEKLFPSSMQAWRNPKAHKNIDMPEAESARKL